MEWNRDLQYWSEPSLFNLGTHSLTHSITLSHESSVYRVAGHTRSPASQHSSIRALRQNTNPTLPFKDTKLLSPPPHHYYLYF